MLADLYGPKRSGLSAEERGLIRGYPIVLFSIISDGTIKSIVTAVLCDEKRKQKMMISALIQSDPFNQRRSLL